GLRGAHVVAHRVGRIEGLQAELQTPLLPKRKILADAGIDVEHAVANHIVPHSGFARPLWAKSCLRQVRMLKNVRPNVYAIDHGVLGIGRHRRRSVGLGIALDVPVRGPGETVVNGDRETSCPTEYAGDMPAAD